MPRRRAHNLSKGELNRLVDDLLHPLFKTKPELILLDTFLHALVEQNPPLTARKFLRYNLPQLMEQLLLGADEP